MVWGATSDREEHRERSERLTAAYHGPAGLPSPRDGQIPGRWKSAPTGSRGGAPIWVMAEAFMPRWERAPAWKKKLAGGHEAPRRTTPIGAGRKPDIEDPDGFAVFGRYPKGFLRHVIALQLLGDVRRDDILHVCSGTLGPEEKWTVDIRPEARPRVVASGTALPFRDGSFRAVMMDPPYSDEYARNLYRTGMPRNSWLLREAARVVVPGGRIGILHVAVPFSPPGCWLVKVFGISTGVGFRIRAFTVYERAQAGLDLLSAVLAPDAAERACPR